MTPLPPRIDPSVSVMEVEEKPDVTYEDIGGCKEAIEKLREVIELPLLSVRQLSSRFLQSNDSPRFSQSASSTSASTSLAA